MKPATKAKPADQLRDDEDDFIPIDIRRLVISTFAIWQIMMAVLWLLPGSPIENAFLKPLREYMWATGGDQNWAMFAPNPAQQDIYLSAIITYRDGTQKSWNFPRMHDLGYIQRYQEERFRKMIEFGHMSAHSVMWPPLARFAGLSNNSNPQTNPVMHVSLVLHTLDIPNIGVPMPPYTTNIFYQADYGPGGLAR